jgi:mercuric ion transport protein
MNTGENQNKIAGLGILAALASSLCCIAPLLAIIAGVSGFAGMFSWIEPARPYLLGFTAVMLGTAWYQKLKPKKKGAGCNCETENKISFFQSKIFLGMITLLAVGFMSFPFYANIAYPEKENQGIVNESSKEIANFEVEGMTCTGCEHHIISRLSGMKGYISAEADYKTGKVRVEFDKNIATEEQVIDVINETGYKVLSEK